MTHSLPPSLCPQQAEAFRQELSMLMEGGRHDFHHLLCGMQENELLATTSLCLTTAQLRVPAVLQFAARLFRLHEHALSFETASRLCKTLMDVSAHDLGAPDRINFSEYLYYSVHYASSIQNWQIHSIIPSLYADQTPLGRVLGGHLALDVVLLSVCRLNARRLKQTDWLRKKPDLNGLAFIIHTLHRYDLLDMAELHKTFSHVLEVITGYALRSMQATAANPRD
ncbi:hypothetical protein OQ496_03235 [Acetobacter suratthaniensis]|uniref:Uncharacterized protein n=1 Tax=Acetobacter suratthaniensis TaxID=1502841 RepID=A0ABS3LH61_9PROT|nr:hypothetical protein [Acetobacter suratthaniensis]MBO1326920.1 hypothetical protein [Acetobacter suratthaniensis]MCX2565470.1 hypothetical protein [Acetobacter suratthaniensis]